MTTDKIIKLNVSKDSGTRDRSNSRPRLRRHFVIFNPRKRDTETPQQFTGSYQRFSIGVNSITAYILSRVLG